MCRIPLSVKGQSLRVPCAALLLLACCLLRPVTAAAGMAGPWSVSPAAPVVAVAAEQPSRVTAAPPAPGVAAAPFLWLMTFYQQVISPVDGDRCPMYPTCSQYFIQATHKHGPAVGIMMTADRLMHESGERDHVPLARVGNRLRFLDPVENNDFWWAAP